MMELFVNREFKNFKLRQHIVLIYVDKGWVGVSI